MRHFLKIIGKSLMLFLFCQSGYADNMPVLVDIAITGSQDNPSFEPKQLQFNLDQEVVLVITNETSQNVIFNHQKLGQYVFTYQLQGTSNVSQENFGLMPNSKVQWHFMPQQEAKLQFYAAPAGLIYHGSFGEIVIRKKGEALPNTPPAAEKLSSKTTIAQQQVKKPSSLLPPLFGGSSKK